MTVISTFTPTVIPTETPIERIIPDVSPEVLIPESPTSEVVTEEPAPVMLTDGGCRYQMVADNTLMAVIWEKHIGAAEIPERVEGKLVTAIGDGAFEGEEGLIRVVLSASVT